MSLAYKMLICICKVCTKCVHALLSLKNVVSPLCASLISKQNPNNNNFYCDTNIVLAWNWPTSKREIDQEKQEENSLFLHLLPIRVWILYCIYLTCIVQFDTILCFCLSILYDLVKPRQILQSAFSFWPPV